MTINLRPWREANRQKQQRSFTQLSLAALMLGLLISLLLWHKTTSAITHIQKENQLIKQHLTQLELEINAVTNLREKRQQLLKRITIIQQLQNKRAITVELMQQLASSINDGVFLTELKRTETALLLKGQANTSQAIAAWMRDLKTQSRYGEPILRSMINNDKTRLTHFDLLIPLQALIP